MISHIFIVLLLILTFVLTSCSKNQTTNDKPLSEEKDSKQKLPSDNPSSELAKYDISSANPIIINLPPELEEISGLTMTPDGRLFGEQDEQGIVYQIDYTNGNIIKKFTLGDPPIRKDFEDITFVNNKFYLMHSNGDIYEFNDGADKESVPYKVYKTGLKKENNIEGMCYDSETNSLLLACKGAAGPDDNVDKAVYSFSLETMKLDPKPRFLLKKDEIKNYFNPSGIQRNPKTGTFFLIAANGNVIVEISKEGNFIAKEKLANNIHAQPEGITFAPDNSLLISNEGKGGIANIVIYSYKQ